MINIHQWMKGRTPNMPNAKYTIKNLIQEVISINNRANLSNTLDEKIDRLLFALEYLDDNIELLTVHNLKEFVREVDRQRRRELLDECQADLLVGPAQTVLSQLARSQAVENRQPHPKVHLPSQLHGVTPDTADQRGGLSGQGHIDAAIGAA
jgi:hypothetical protein